MAQKIYNTYAEALQFAVELGFKYGEVMVKRREDESYSTIQASDVQFANKAFRMRL